MDFGAMIPALMAGKVDMIGACITITAERRKSVLFSDTYYVGGISALVRQ
jgi:polar amino acid transport system substrate-binding protein